MTKIVFASRNKGKIKEIEALLEGVEITLLSLYNYKDVPDILENGQSFFENAMKKARIVSEWTGETVLADDSGLEVDALGGAPGIYSARYAGDDATDAGNIRKLLKDLKGMKPDKRGGAFRCVLVLYRPGGHFERFEGRWQGRIADKPAGTGGFGYDPVFFLPEFSMTVAQLPLGLKNELSHRAIAFRKLKNYLQGITFAE
ncbi:MAG: XTP/dITP diphosphatase [Pseudomonadota bacterium]